MARSTVCYYTVRISKIGGKLLGWKRRHDCCIKYELFWITLGDLSHSHRPLWEVIVGADPLQSNPEIRSLLNLTSSMFFALRPPLRFSRKQHGQQRRFIESLRSHLGPPEIDGPREIQQWRIKLSDKGYDDCSVVQVLGSLTPGLRQVESLIATDVLVLGGGGGGGGGVKYTLLSQRNAVGEFVISIL